MKTRTVKNEAGGWDMQCDCGFKSTGWPTRKAAAARGGEHTDEHDTATQSGEDN